VEICFRAFLHGRRDLLHFSLPGERRMTVMIRKNANARPMTAHNIDNGTLNSE